MVRRRRFAGTRPVREGGRGAGSMSPPPTATSRSTASRSTGRCASSATTSSPWRTTSPPTSGRSAKCLEDVAASDLYVAIFAHRYGYIPDQDNPDGRSITELEYRHARALGKPCLVFLLDPAASWPPTSMDAFTGDGDHGARIRCSARSWAASGW